VDCIQEIAEEFHRIKALHQAGPPAALPLKVGVLTAWGKLRSWTCSGHFHENPENDLINLIESLSGLPFAVEFLDFDEIRSGAAEGLDVLINAGFRGSAWSGGDAWRDDRVVAALTRWVHGGGTFLGVNAPSAVEGSCALLRMAPVLGVDIDTGARVNHGRWPVEPTDAEDTKKAGQVPGAGIAPRGDVYLIDGETQVLLAEEGRPCVTSRAFGKGRGVYLASYRHSLPNARLLCQLMAGSLATEAVYSGLPPQVDCAAFPASGKALLANAGESSQRVRWGEGEVEIPAYGMATVDYLGQPAQTSGQ
jgi:beta-D-galactosyl-(1->4)-L-rhamnose phosphorylase